VWCSFLASRSAAQVLDQKQKLADKIVHDVLPVKTSEVVVVTGDFTQMELIDDLALSIRKAGAFAITYVGSNTLKKSYYERVPQEFDNQPPEDLLGLAHIAAAFVNIAYPFDPSINAGVSPTRLRALARSNAIFQRYLLDHNIPEINVGNGVFASPGNAAKFGVPEAALAQVFWSGVNADYGQIRRDALAMGHITTDKSHKVHITAPNGTDFSFVTVPGSAIMNDGSISAADLMRGGAALEKQPPAGDVYVLPKPGSANGAITFGTEPLHTGNLVRWTVHFVNGSMTTMQADSGFAAVQKAYDAATKGKDTFAWADFPVNRSIHLGPGTWGAGPSMAAGWVTAGIGYNLPQGGTNGSSFSLSSNIPDATVKVDGAVIISGGKLLL
jgi:leucyl aminopeptidase (aminopeptidase T)